MKGGNFGYLVKQGLGNVWLNRVMSLASVAILTACLILMGVAGLITVNVREVFLELESQNEMAVFLHDDATEEEIKDFEKVLLSFDHVKEVNYVSKEQGLEELKEQGYSIDRLEDDNPLPNSYRVTLDSLEYLDEVQAKIQSQPIVDSISAPTQLAGIMTDIQRIGVIFGATMIGFLLIASIVVISNTIKLTVFARRREINIMKYVGATNRFIRLPFSVEGIALGFISAILAFVVIALVYQSLAGALVNLAVEWIQPNAEGIIKSFWSLWHWVLGGFLFSGILIGSLGCSSAIRKHLQV